MYVGSGVNRGSEFSKLGILTHLSTFSPLSHLYAEYPPQCPCPMQQSCPKNVHTGPHIGSNNRSNSNSFGNSSSISNNSSSNSNSCSAMSHLSNNSNNMLMNGSNNNSNNSSSSNREINSSSNCNSNNSSITTNNSQHSSHNNSNSMNNSLTTSRGPVKKPTTTTTTTLTTTATLTSTPVTATAVALTATATTPTQIDELLLFGKQQSQQHLDLLQAVKSELKLEDSDNKSQYEESVVQPPTPPESYTTNDEKLLDTLTEHELSSASLPATIEEANAKLHSDCSNKRDKKLAEDESSRQQPIARFATVSNRTNAAQRVVEAYDLTTTATVTPPPSTPTSAATTNNNNSNGGSVNSNSNSSAANSAAAPPFVGRKARIGKTMAREMVYAGAAANMTAQTQSNSQVPSTPLIQVRTLPQQPSVVMQSQQQQQKAQQTQQQKQQQQQQQAQAQLAVLRPEQLLAAITPSASPQVPATLSECFPGATTALQSPLQAPFLIKTEIKAEKIKLEDEEPLLSAVLQLQQQQESRLSHGEDGEKSELKLIKAEPLTVACEEVTAVVNSVAANATLKPLGKSNFHFSNVVVFKAAISSPTSTGRMRLLPSWQQPPIIQCDIDLSTTSDDDVLDLCHSPTTSTSGGSGQKPRLKIFNLPKTQQPCKKSSPNGYKSLIKQTEPRTYLCLSGRKLDKRGRYSKLQIRQAGKAGGVSGTIRRRQLVLTDQQKKQLKLRKKKLQALERRKQELLEKRRAAAKQERMQRRKLLKKSIVARGIKQEEVEPSVEEIVDLVEEPDQTESEFSEVTQPEVPCMRMLLSESSSLSSSSSGNCNSNSNGNSNSNSSSSMNTIRITPKPSPKRGKPPRKTCIPLHLLETIDSVARGYFSEPETSRCSGALNTYASCDATDTEPPMDKSAAGRKPKKDKKASAEKRSKSETKKPIKSADATSAACEVIDAEYTLAAAHATETTSAATAAEFAFEMERKAPLDLSQYTAAVQGEPTETVYSAGCTNKSANKSKRTPTKRKTAKAKKPKKQGASKKRGNVKARQQAFEFDTPAVQLGLETNNNVYEKCSAEDAVLDEADRQAKIDVETADEEASAYALHDEAEEQQQQQQHYAQPLEKHSNAQVFLPPVPPMPRIVCQPHHGAKRTRSRSKFGSRKRQKVKHSTVSFELDDRLPPATRVDVVPKWNNGWTWEGEPFQGAVFLNVSAECWLKAAKLIFFSNTHFSAYRATIRWSFAPVIPPCGTRRAT